MVKVDVGPFCTVHNNMWPELDDKGYQGAEDLIWVIHPHKCMVLRVQTNQQIEENSAIVSEREIEENYIGCLRSNWNIQSA